MQIHADARTPEKSSPLYCLYLRLLVGVWVIIFLILFSDAAVGHIQFLADLEIGDQEGYLPHLASLHPCGNDGPAPWEHFALQWGHCLLGLGGMIWIGYMTEQFEAQSRAQQRLEKQLRQSQKMEAIGRLAGGIAHDFNNMLSPIIIYSEVGMEELGEESPVRSILERIHRISLRAADLVKQILSICRQQEQEKVVTQLTPMVKESLKLLRASLPATIEIIPDLSRESGAVLVDPTQIHQILLNLGANAAQAMGEQGGILRVSLEPVDLPEELAAYPMPVPPGPYTALTVEDTGPGMDPATLEHIFDPYYTTKGPGKGTGLGLAVVQGIVQAHGGIITLRSAPGQGTIFQIYFPRRPFITPAEPQAIPPLPTGHGSILVIDDEPDLVNSWRLLLQNLGYEVTALTNSAEALECFRTSPDQFELIIADQTMPHLTGIALAKEILKIRSQKPIILCTDEDETISEQQARDQGIQGFFLKPVTVRQMSEAVQRLLSKGRERWKVEGA